MSTKLESSSHANSKKTSEIMSPVRSAPKIIDVVKFNDNSTNNKRNKTNPIGGFSKSEMGLHDDAIIYNLDSTHGKLVFSKDDPAWKSVHDVIEISKNDDCSVLIEGERGTGKELVARAIHYAGKRNKKKLHPVNLSYAENSDLIISKLFGHVIGAYTGAMKNRNGVFVEAGEGSLFLDEIGNLPLDAQGILLRAIEENVIVKLGSDNEIKIRCRVIAATNKNLTKLIDEGRFMPDLYDRLRQEHISLPSWHETSNKTKGFIITQLLHEADRSVTYDLDNPEEIGALFKSVPGGGNVRGVKIILNRVLRRTKPNEKLTLAKFKEIIATINSCHTDQLPLAEYYKELKSLKKDFYLQKVAEFGSIKNAAQSLKCSENTIRGNILNQYIKN